MTEAEIKVWQCIRRRQIHDVQFYRQRAIGEYIVDFYAPSVKLIIEIDGGQHFLSGKLIDEDIVREEFLRAQELQILRFTNIEVLQNIEGVMMVVYRYIEERKSPQPPFSKGE
jgi:very-short-patch-repair endonuclease